MGGRHGRFLVLEDDTTVARALCRLARPFGGAEAAGSVREALEKLQTEAWQGFVIDIGLPDGTGLEVLRAARVAFPTTPAMLLTARLEADLVNAAFDLRAPYVVKPVEALRLRQFFADATSEPKRRRAPENLKGAIAQLQALLGRRADTKTNFAMGVLVAKLKAHPERFGRRAVATAAAELGVRGITLYRLSWVAEAISPPELRGLLARAGEHADDITWSHLLSLASLPPGRTRERLARRLIDERLSVRALTALVRAARPRAVPSV